LVPLAMVALEYLTGVVVELEMHIRIRRGEPSPPWLRALTRHA
jgi:hypothetical protein